MPTHDIIDNRNEKLVDHINRILASTEAARFAVGYFFLSGLESLAERLGGVKELRLLIGNTTNSKTLEQLAEGYRRLELVAETAEAQSYPKRTEARQMATETAENIRSSVELMDQTDEGEVLVKTLVRMIEEKQLKVRIYTKGRMHAKAYIFDYGTVFDERGKPVDRHGKGIAIVGSSNLTLSGVTHNTELNVVVQGNDNHAELVRWFEDLWKESQDFDEALMQEIQQSWAIILAEGLNLQDCNKIINYDLHWNPVRLIQRFGRIDRIGSDHDVVYGFNFLPETGIERNLGLRQTLRNRIQEIHDTIGEDSAILDRTEQLNEDAMYAIYEKKGGQLELFDDEEEEFVDLNEAEEILRQLRRENLGEYERIASLRDGIRTARPSSVKGLSIFCEASYPERPDLKGYQQLFLIDEAGEVVSGDIPRILGIIKCGQDQKGAPLPAGYNKAVMQVKRRFAEEVKHRQAEREHTLSLKQGQRYLLRELRVLFGATDDEDEKAQINILEKAFRGPTTSAIDRELNLLRRNGVTGQELLKTLVHLYHQHNMREWLDRRSPQSEDQQVPKIVCSEALV